MLVDMQPPTKPRRPTARARALLAALGLVLFLGILYRGGSRSPTQPAAAATAKRQAAPAWPKVKTMHDLEVLWEVPKKPKRVLFVAHGCSHAGSDFWPASPACKHCLGLPEEVAVRQAALKRGYAVVAVTSFNRESGCWHNTAPARSEDLRRLPAILRELLGTQALAKLPLFAFGASSGGSMALRLAAVMPEVEGVVCQISPVNPATLEAEGGRKFPPTLFVHMAQRDPEKAATVEAALKLLKKAGTPAAEIKVAPQPVTAALLQRAAEISGKQAKAVVAALKKGGALDKKGFLKADPRSSASNWRALVQPVAGGLSLEADVSPLAELLNVAWARHEIVSDHTAASLAWLEAGGKKRVGRRRA